MKEFHTEGDPQLEHREGEATELGIFSGMNQEEFLEYFSTLIRGFNEEQAATFTESDWIALSANKEKRLNSAKNLLKKLVPNQAAQIGQISGLHGESLNLLREIHELYIASQLEENAIVPESVLRQYPNLRKGRDENKFVEENGKKVELQIIEILRIELADVFRKYYLDPEKIVQVLRDKFAIKKIPVEITRERSYVSVIDQKTGLEYIMPFENNRPLQMDISNFFELRDLKGNPGYSNAPIDRVENPAVVGKREDQTLGSYKIAILKGQVVVKDI